MKRKIALLLSPLIALLLFEILFRFGAWEPFAKPASHAGTSVKLKRALQDSSVTRLDFVTLGSSRSVYGIDHARLAALAIKRRMIHANLSMHGAHWMSIGILTRWLSRERPTIHGGIIALSIQDFSYAGNGQYELGIIQPFRIASDTSWIKAHVPFERENFETYALYSALFGWRDDMRDFIRRPFSRLAAARNAIRRSSPAILFRNLDSTDDMCATGIDSLAVCETLEQSATADANLVRQCKQVRDELSGRPDFDKLMQENPLPQFMRDTRDLVRSQLRSTPWNTPPIVVLMPLPEIWRSGTKAKGLHRWTLKILKPLVDERRITLIDATDFFDNDRDGGCSKFFDFYHQNSAGQAQFSEWLFPTIEESLYSTLTRNIDN